MTAQEDTAQGGTAMPPATAQARVIVDELVRCGVEDVVLCAGSRSAALAIALAEAENADRLRLHVDVDERGAGFVAVGIAKVSGAPVGVLCTSGTAVANLLPSVVEASHSGLPLVLLTADRPAELRQVGANQTTDQVRMFDGFVRVCIDVPAAEDRSGQVGYWRSVISSAVAAATSPWDPGPVQVNVAARVPLVGTGEQWHEPLDGRPGGLPWHADGRLSSWAAPELGDLIEPVPERGLVIIGDCGQDEAEAAQRLAIGYGWPVIAEPSANAAAGGTTLAHGPLVLAAIGVDEEFAPDLVVTVGKVGLERSVNQVIVDTAARPDGVHVDVNSAAASRGSDPNRTAAMVLSSVPLPPVDAEPDMGWFDLWEAADRAVGVAVDRAIEDAPGLLGAEVARQVYALTDPTSLLLVGASWPVRHVFRYAGHHESPGFVIGNRGQSGIDGLVSTTLGAALAHDGPVIGLIGDIAFLHDVNALLLASEVEDEADAVLVVIDNDGGGIFSELEQAGVADDDAFERVFGTPQGQDLVQVATGFGVDAVRVRDAAELVDRVNEAIEAGGVHVVVASTVSRGDEAHWGRQVAEDVADAVAEAAAGELEDDLDGD